MEHFFSALVNYAKYVTQQPRTAMTCSLSCYPDYEYEYGVIAPDEYNVFVVANAKTKLCEFRQPNGSPRDNVSYI